MPSAGRGRRGHTGSAGVQAIAGAERHGHGDDHAAGAHLARAVGADGHAVRVLGDRAHGRLEDDVERLRQLPREQLRAAHEAVLLRAALRVEQRLQPAGGVDVEEHVEQRGLDGVDRPDGLEREPEHRPRRGRAHVAPQPGLERLRVPPRGAPGGPRRLERDAAGHQVQPRHRLAEVGQRERVHRRDRAAVAVDLLPRGEQVLALGVRRVRRHAELARQRQQPVLRRPDPLRAELDHLVRPGADRLVQRPAADAVARLEHHDGAPRGREPPGGGEPREPGADDGDVRLPHRSPS